jgi:hypothetical protein
MKKFKFIVRSALGGAVSSSLVGLPLFNPAAADTILFPVIALNTPNVTTIVSVINSPGATSSDLKYTYRHKATLVGSEPNTQGLCNESSFSRNTSDGDIVSFDASGFFNGGQALFGDNNNPGTFDIGLSGPLRGYLLVANDDPEVVGNPLDLTGESVVLDIATGAAWGMKAVNDENRENDDFVNASAATGGVWSALPNNGDSRRFSFFPMNEWTTRFFVTPIGTNMDTANLSATISLTGDVYDRSATPHTFTPIQQSVTCTGAVDLQDLMDSSTAAAVETGGGWSWFRVVSGDAVVYKLEFVVDDPTYGGTNNNGYLLSDRAAP